MGEGGEEEEGWGWGWWGWEEEEVNSWWVFCLFVRLLGVDIMVEEGI